MKKTDVLGCILGVEPLKANPVSPKRLLVCIFYLTSGWKTWSEIHLCVLLDVFVRVVEGTRPGA